MKSRQRIKFRKPQPKKPLGGKTVAEIVRELKESTANASNYREQSLKIHGLICAKCGREFEFKDRNLLTVHHKDGNHRNNPADGSVVAAFLRCGAFAQQNVLRLTFHPDQFVVLGSPNRKVVLSSIAELEYQAEVASWIGADVITIHGGGSYGDKPTALDRWRRNFARLSKAVRTWIALENDDRVYTPTDLLPVCQAAKIPLVYDVHHHRCNPDDLHEEEATQQARATCNREPLFHVSSPLGGWSAANVRKHNDFIALRDFPPYWSTFDITVEVEAKAKEVAIAKLRRALQSLAARQSGAKSPQRATGSANRKECLGACWAVP